MFVDDGYAATMSANPTTTPATTLFAGQVVVVETEDEHYLGMLDVDGDGWLRVRTGFRGHPHLVDPDEVVSVTLAADHPLSD